MNLNGDEKKIQRLFREMSLEDRRQTPQFNRVLRSATSDGSSRRIRPTRLAVLVATVIVVALLAVVAVQKRESGDNQKPEEGTVLVLSPEPSPQFVPPKKDLPRRSGPDRRRVARWRPATELAIGSKSLFAWRSPTASLLRSDANNLFIPIPRLGESLETIKSFSPDLWN